MCNDAFRPATERIPETCALWSFCRRPVGRGLRRRFAIDEGGDLRGDLRLERRGLIRSQLVARDRFVDVRVGGRRQRGHETVAALAFVVSDIAEALSAPHRGRY